MITYSIFTRISLMWHKATSVEYPMRINYTTVMVNKTSLQLTLQLFTGFHLREIIYFIMDQNCSKNFTHNQNILL